jgi:nucleoside-diphosphate-sugar epimerase
MRALVTGGAGFIGSHLVDTLVSEARDVVVLDSLTTGYPENVNSKANLIVGDLADEGVFRGAMEGCDVVFHEAAHRAALRSVERPVETNTVNTSGTSRSW